MILTNEPSGASPAPVIKPAPARQVRQIEPLEFYQVVDVGVPGLVQCIVTNKPDGNPGYNTWQKPGEDFATFAVKQSNKSHRAYHSVGAYPPGMVSSISGRTAANAQFLKCFWLDIDVINCIDADGKPYTHGKENSAYPDAQSAITAVNSFLKEIGARPSLIVETGSGGFQIYFVLDAPITKEEWLPRARALAALCVKHGLIVDTPVTCDAARILRAPGSFHNKTGKLVTAMRGRVEPYTLDEIDAKFGYVPGTLPAVTGPGKVGAMDANINDADILDGAHTPYSYKQAAQRCGAMRKAAERNGRDTPYPVWLLTLVTADKSIEGREFAHEISSGHEGYGEAIADKKTDSLKGGPANCEAWANAWGPGGPCDSCEWRGKIKNPAVQLGALVDTIPPDGAMVGAVVPKLSREVLKTELADWYVNKDGEKIKPMMTTVNVRGLLRANGWKVQYNVMNKRVETIMPGSRTPRDDHENAALAFLGDVAVRAGMSRDGLPELVDAVAGENAVHPVQSWIESKPWDGTSRLSLFHESLELVDANHAPLRDSLMDAWALQCIGAIYEPEGIAAQGVLVLVGPQGCNKTRWMANLCPVPGAIRTGIHLNPLDKDSVLRATNGWIGELGELDSTTRKSDQSALKAYLTNQEDVLRPPYARKENVYRRRTVYGGTVNGGGWLVDETGDRRFWPATVKWCHLLPAETMQQIWAEYLEKYRAGERWHLDSHTKALLSDTNAAHRVVDPIRERIITMFDWASLDWAELAHGENRRTNPNLQWMTATDICIRIGLDRPSKADATRAGSVTSELNRATFRKSNGAKLLAVPGPLRGGL